jgi:hypothetical protein
MLGLGGTVFFGYAIGYLFLNSNDGAFFNPVINQIEKASVSIVKNVTDASIVGNSSLQSRLADLLLKQKGIDNQLQIIVDLLINKK